MQELGLTPARLNSTIEFELAERTRLHQSIVSNYSAAHEARQTLPSAITPKRPLILLALGDSWFDYPLLNNGPVLQKTDIVAQLEQYGAMPFKILNLAHRGDASTDAMSLPKQQRAISALRNRANWVGGKPDAILFSAGGNDVAGDQFCNFLDFNDGTSKGLNINRFKKILGSVEASYSTLFELRNRYAPGVPIYGHSYGLAIPNGVHPSCAGPWLKPSLDLCGWSLQDGTRIVKEALLQFESMLESLEVDAGNNFHLIKTQGLLKAADWANELHPGYLGFRKVVKRFREIIANRYSRNMPST